MSNEQHLQNANRLILLTGATGYVGARLLRALEQQALQVRACAAVDRVQGGIGAPKTETVYEDENHLKLRFQNRV